MQSNNEMPDDLLGLDGDVSGEPGFGTNAIIETVRKFMQGSTPPLYDTFLINVDTLIRNVTTKDKSEMEIREHLNRDLSQLLDVITSYMSEFKDLLNMPYVVVYLPHYATGQVLLHSRPKKPGSVKQIIEKIHNQIVQEDNLKLRKQIRNLYNDIDVYELYAGNRAELPYRTLTKFITDQTRFNPVGIRSATRRNVMISHYPLDYYFMQNFPNTVLLESFTGKILKREMLGIKVFNVGHVPFNRVTHLLFGDAVQLIPMAKGKRGAGNTRKLLMDLALRQNWNLRTPNEIAQFVGNSGQVPKEILLNINF